MAVESTPSLIAWWGAGLSTVLAVIKGLEIWRDRFQLEVDHNFISDESMGNTILIRNLSSRPFILTYWELLYCSGRWPRRKFEALSSREHDERDCKIEPHTTHELYFADEHYFDWGYKSLKGRKIYIRLHIAGRKSILRLVYH